MRRHLVALAALASFERAMTQPSLFESTTTGLPRSRG
jgi:hypothetical protein